MRPRRSSTVLRATGRAPPLAARHRLTEAEMDSWMIAEFESLLAEIEADAETAKEYEPNGGYVRATTKHAAWLKARIEKLKADECDFCSNKEASAEYGISRRQLSRMPWYEGHGIRGRRRSDCAKVRIRPRKKRGPELVREAKVEGPVSVGPTAPAVDDLERMTADFLAQMRAARG